ncbi:MAG: leucine-rich repeat protein, partial [Clostridia bacterium]|nr:leucine-rich repeat protein [Clostridia bacterium]
LTVWGSGEMKDYQKTDKRPWDEHINNTKKLVIKDGITSVGDWSFSKFDKLEEIEFANTISSIGERAFYSCERVDYINLPNSVKTIENGAFNSCKSVVRVKLSNSLEIVGDSAFMNLPNVPVVTIPASVNEIGMWAFMGCTSMEQIYFEGKIPEKMGNFCFTEVDENYMLYYNIEYEDNWRKFSETDDEHVMGYLPSDRIPVYLNNKEVCFDVDPVIVEGRTLVPMRAVFEALGAVVSWNGETETVTAQKGDTTLYVQIGSNTIRKNNQIISVDVPAKIYYNRTLVPVRAISEAVSAKVSWNNEERAVYIEI